ncbi:MAG: hypothetical protein F6J93_11155 [Oscillatoria sp. SIO1A7]|nr:hypothetical protein [Oscillatoria sp. SIO1A7]
MSFCTNLTLICYPQKLGVTNLISIVKSTTATVIVFLSWRDRALFTRNVRPTLIRLVPRSRYCSLASSFISTKPNPYRFLCLSAV